MVCFLYTFNYSSCTFGRVRFSSLPPESCSVLLKAFIFFSLCYLGMPGSSLPSDSVSSHSLVMPSLPHNNVSRITSESVQVFWSSHPQIPSHCAPTTAQADPSQLCSKCLMCPSSCSKDKERLGSLNLAISVPVGARIIPRSFGSSRCWCHAWTAGEQG